MAGKSKVTHAPFDPRGNLMHYPHDSYSWEGSERTVIPYERRPNEPFEKALQIEGMRSGRSAKYVVWCDPEGHTYPMFITDLLDLMESGTITNGNTGPRTWIVRKRGQNYGLALYTEGN